MQCIIEDIFAVGVNLLYLGDTHFKNPNYFNLHAYMNMYILYSVFGRIHVFIILTS